MTEEYENLKENLERSVECGLCHDPLDDPRNLPCNHSFCRMCTDALLVFNDDGSATIKCPNQCETVAHIKVSETTSTLPIPYTVVGVLNLIKDLNKSKNRLCNNEASCKSEITCCCEVCQKMYCKSCFLQHPCEKCVSISLNGRFHIHTEEFQPTCTEHNALITDICNTCNSQMVCVYCIHRHHKSHQTVNLKTFANEIRQLYLEKMNTAKQFYLTNKISYKEARKKMVAFKIKLELELNTRMVNEAKIFIENLCRQKSLILEQYKNSVNEWNRYLEDHNLLHDDLVGALKGDIEHTEKTEPFQLAATWNNFIDIERLKTIQCLSVSLSENILNIGQLHSEICHKSIEKNEITMSSIFHGEIKGKFNGNLELDADYIKDFLEETTQEKSILDSVNNEEMLEAELCFIEHATSEDVLHYIKNNDIKKLKILSMFKPSLLNNGEYIYAAVDNNNPIILKLLIESNKEIDVNFSENIDYNFPNLHFSWNRLNELRLNTQEKPLYTSLHHACAKGFNECVEILLNNNANVNTHNENCWTPLHTAVEVGHVQIVENLLKFGGKVDAQGNYDFTPLMRTAQNNHKCVAEVLIYNNADVNKKDCYGRTALHYAVINNYEEVVEVLLLHNAGKLVIDKHAKTAYQYATTESMRSLLGGME